MKNLIEVPIVIIGAGPAGSMAANEIAKRNVPVVLLNRDRFPGEKNVCGGALAYCYKQKLALPSGVIDREISGVEFSYNNSRFQTASNEPQFISVRRPLFDNFLAQSAVSNGAQLNNECEVTGIDATSNVIIGIDHTTNREFAYRSRLTIFADGPDTLAFPNYHIGFNRNQGYFVAVQYELSGTPDKMASFDFYCDQALELGYYWAFPKSGAIDIGVGSFYQKSSDINYHALLKSFLSVNPGYADFSIIKKQGGIIPAFPAQRFVAPGALVVGDAAGLVNPLTGGGIVHALKSGQIAGRIAALAYEKQDFSLPFLRRYAWSLKLTPHYMWIRFLHTFAHRHLHRALNRQSSLLPNLLKTYFEVIRLVSKFTRII